MLFDIKRLFPPTGASERPGNGRKWKEKGQINYFISFEAPFSDFKFIPYNNKHKHFLKHGSQMQNDFESSRR